MKKKLEADLISIAHRILQLKNKSDINQLYLETQKLYEKLSVLRFVDEHFSDLKPTIGGAALEQKIESIFENSEVTNTDTAFEIVTTTSLEILETAAVAESTEVETVLQTVEPTETDLQENTFEESTTEDEEEELLVDEEEIEAEIAIEEPEEKEEEAIVITETDTFAAEAEDAKETEQETPKKKEPVQISFEDLLGGNYHDTQFVKVQEIKDIPKEAIIETTNEIVETTDKEAIVKDETVEQKAVSLNEKLAKGINIDLNDRIAFIKHLFGNSSEDYNRVLSQLITFNTFYETRDFVQEMVKPDYNNWEGKQDYEERFMDIIEKKFL